MRSAAYCVFFASVGAVFVGRVVRFMHSTMRPLAALVKCRLQRIAYGHVTTRLSGVMSRTLDKRANRPQDSGMTLKEWLKGRPRGSAAKLAVEAGTSRQTISHLVRLKQTPSVDLAIRIAAATGGAVAVSDWPRAR